MINICLFCKVCIDTFLFLFQVGPQVTEDTGHAAVVKVRVLLAHHTAVTLTEYQEGIHGPPYIPLLTISLHTGSVTENKIILLLGIGQNFIVDHWFCNIDLWSTNIFSYFSLLPGTNFRVISNFMIFFYCHHLYQSVNDSDKHIFCMFSINVNESKNVLL